MPLYEPTVPSRYLQLVIALVKEQKPAALSVILREAGITRTQLRAPATVTMGQFDALLCVATRRLGRSDLGFLLGQRLGRDSHGALSLVLASCTTIEAILTMITRYWRLISPAAVLRYQRHADHGEYMFRPGAAMSRIALYTLEEAIAVAFHRDCTAALGRVQGLEVWFSMPAPAHLARYEKLAPTRFHFAANALPELRCVVPGGLLDVPIAHLPVDANALDSVRRAAVGAATRRRQVSDWITLILREAEGVQPSLSDLAEILDVSERTLSRQLASEGCNLRELGCDIRQERARAMLHESAQPIEHIAARLGYGSPEAFATAFRRTSGMSPRDYRKSSLISG